MRVAVDKVVAVTGLGYAVRFVLEEHPTSVNKTAMKISEGKLINVNNG